MPPKADSDLTVKLLLIGDSGVGKSCLLLRFADDSFTSSYISTIGIDFKMRKLQIDQKQVKVQIWDTAGQERFRTITAAYYRNAMGILLVYDITDEKSFENIRSWMRNIESNADSHVNKILVGNKSDMSHKRAIPFAHGQRLANEFGIKFFETSAKTSQNVEEVFTAITREVMRRLSDQEEEEKRTIHNMTDLINPSQPVAKKSSGCC